MSVGACAALPGTFGASPNWKEEIVLHDGRTIVVQRSQQLGGYPTLASRERVIVEEKWIIPFPGKAEPIVWKTGYCRPPGCKRLMLMLMQADEVTGVPYLATTPAGCLAYNYWGRPNPPYAFLGMLITIGDE